jgi:NhaP-type Na+/H+ or K+/H+ antiporter
LPWHYLQSVPPSHSGTTISSPLLLLVCLYLITIFSRSFLRVGSAISWDGYFNLQTEHDAFSSILDLVLNCACFIYIGAWLPFNQFHISELGISPWRLVMLVLVILALRRIPSILILYKWMPEVSNWREALFCGHFGPVSLFPDCIFLNYHLILCH